MRTLSRLAAILVPAVLAVAPAAAEVPSTLNLAGRLTDPSGQPLSGAHDIEVRLYGAATGGTALWTEAHDSVMANAGAVFLALGDTTPFGATVFDGGARWLELRIDGAPLTPRLPVASVPYALRADVASVADEAVHADSADTAMTAQSAQTAVTAQSATTATSATNATNAVNATNATNATNAVNATNADTATRVGTYTAAMLQARVAGTCAAGSSIRVINTDGTVTCETDDAGTSSGGDVTAVTAGTGLTGGGTSGDLALALNLGAANTWTGRATFAGGLGAPSGTWDTTGRVGIGTTAPASSLDVRGTISTPWAFMMQHYEAGYGANAARPFLNKAWNGTYGDFLYLGATGNRSNAETSAMVLGGGGVQFGTGTDAGNGLTTVLMNVNAAGNLQIGTGTTGCVTNRAGSILTGTCSSDRRFKRDIEPFAPVLARLRQLAPVTYRWRTDEFPARHFGAGRVDGLIAQDVAAVMPELVTTDADGYLAVHYEKLPLLLLESTRELAARADAADARAAALEARLDRLERERRGPAERGGRGPIGLPAVPLTLGLGLVGLGVVVAGRRRR